MTLREQISVYLYNKKITHPKEHANEILKMIEKRIDYVIARLDSNDDRIKIHVLNQVKEILK